MTKSAFAEGPHASATVSFTAKLVSLWLRASVVKRTFVAIGIVLASLATASALLSGAGWAKMAATITAGLFFLYGVVQIVSGFLIQGGSQAGLIFAGIMYILLGVVANWIGSMVQPAPNKSS